MDHRINDRAAAAVLQPSGPAVGREECARLLASRVEAGQMTAADAAALLAEYDERAPREQTT